MSHVSYIYVNTDPLRSGLLYGSSLVWYNVLNATASLLLSNPPYNFASSDVGLMYLGPLCGAALGYVTAPTIPKITSTNQTVVSMLDTLEIVSHYG